MKALTDEEIIARHDRSVRSRARTEILIVNAILARAAELGSDLEVWVYGDGEPYGEKGTYDVKTAIFDLEAAIVEVYSKEGDRIGNILLVRGNDGYDLVSDYHVSLEEWLAPVNKLADSL